jgi:transcriptional regulator with XRE-family HTH domain
MANSMIGKRIAEKRQLVGISQTELASRLGVTRQALNNYERGLREPDLSLTADIARVLNTTTDYLLGRTEPSPTSEPLVDEQVSDVTLFTDSIKRLCRRDNVTLRKVLTDCGFTSNIFKTAIHTQELPSVKDMRRIADYFKTSVEYLTGQTDDPRSPGKLLVVPDDMKDVLIAAHHGEEDWTQDEYDEAAAYVRFVRERRKNQGR